MKQFNSTQRLNIKDICINMDLDELLNFCCTINIKTFDDFSKVHMQWLLHRVAGLMMSDKDYNEQWEIISENPQLSDLPSILADYMEDFSDQKEFKAAQIQQLITVGIVAYLAEDIDNALEKANTKYMEDIYNEGLC